MAERTALGSAGWRSVAQFGRDFAVQHLFQPDQDFGDQGGIGNPVVPADHDIDGLVRRSSTPKLRMNGPGLMAWSSPRP